MEIVLPDGSKKTLDAGATVADVAASIGAGLAKAALAGKIDGKLVDLTTPPTMAPQSRSSRRKALRRCTSCATPAPISWPRPCRSCSPARRSPSAPATDDGYFYDFLLPENISSDDFGAIEKKMQQIIKANEPFVREVVTIDQAKEIFADQRFKLEHIDDLADEQITIYRHGSFVDLCSGPHIPSAGKIGAIKLMKLAGAYWRADASRGSCSASTARRFSRRPSLTSICTTSKRPRSATIARSAARWTCS